MRKGILLVLFLVVWAPALLRTQSLFVWPGDANNNGLVNNVDLLQIGLAYNYFGPDRDSASSYWQAQTATPWTQVAGNGVNGAYSDANGDGLVNYFYDAFPIYVHYGLTHGTVSPDLFPQGLPSIDPPLYLDSSAVPPQIFPGTMVNLPLEFGTAGLPVDDLYGLAFSLHVDPQFIDVADVLVSLNQLSWANPDNDRIYSAYQASDSRVDVGWVRTDHNERSGYGPIGSLSFIIIDVVVSLEQQVELRIDSIQMIDRLGNITAVAGDTLTITVLPNAVASGATPEDEPFRVWPNPARDYLYLQAPEPMAFVRLFDALGCPVAALAPGIQEMRWQLPDLPAGMYWLEIQTSGQLYRQKIILRE